MAPPGSEKRTDIEGLRAIAVVLVVLYHCRVPGLSGGFIGVDVFFALSGFLITRLLVREFDRAAWIDLPAFYARRAKRLLPAVALTTGATLAASWALLGPLDEASFTGAALASTLYIGNLWFGLNATDYLAAPPDSNPFLHLWSLAVEEQFYLAWPVAILVLSRFALPHRTWWLLALCAASFVLTIALQVAGLSHWAFFGSPARAWEFGLGGVFALGRGQMPGQCAWGGLALIAIPAALYGPTTPFPGLAAIAPVLGTLLVLVSPDGIVRGWLATPVLQRLGAWSYGWYLWHWPVLVLGRTLMPTLGLAASLALSSLALVLAALSFRFVEAPIRHSHRLEGRAFRTLTAAAALTVLLVGTTLVWQADVARGIATPAQRAFAQVRREMPAIYRSGCHLDVDQSIVPPCEFGDTSASTSVVLWGDSHAAQWFPAVEAAARMRGWRLISMTKSGCPPADIGGRPMCRAWRRNALEAIRSRHPDLVVLANANVYLDGSDDRAIKPTQEAFVDGERRTLVELAPVPTAVVLPLPRPGFDVPKCLARAQWHPWLSQGCQFVDRPLITVQGERLASVGLRHVTLFDLSAEICGPSRCQPVVDQLISYRDDHHLTPALSARMAPAIARLMAAAMAPARRPGSARPD
jgi:peptidoglycan/LPS O-acetylase OafA/YrhL